MRSQFVCSLLAVLSLAASTSTPAAERNPARLDNTVAPTAESVSLTLAPAEAEFSGTVHIDLKAAASVDSFQLNTRKLTLKSATLMRAGKAVPLTWHDAAMERTTFRSAKPLPPGAYTLDIAFSGPFDTKATGLYHLKAHDDWYAFTQFEADDARQAFPCWDEPEFKIPWSLKIEAPAGLVVLGNTPVEKKTEASGRQTVTFQRTPPMPSYLVAFAVGPFEFVDIPGTSVPARVVTPKGQTALAGEAVKMTGPLLTALEAYFKRPYPFPKLDLIAVPEYNYGAMENPGLITFNDRGILLEPNATTDEQRARLAGTITHELAHMWFGDLVTMTWWDDLWLNESFAEWMGNKITDQVYPQYRLPIQEVQDTRRAYGKDDHASTHAMRQRVDETVNLDQMADALAYQKGQAVLGMVETWTGPEVFRQGVIDYLKAHEWKNATASDLWAALSKAAGSDVASAMESYLDQPGVPVVAVELLPNRQIKLTQSRYLPYGESVDTKQLWKIPVVLRMSDGKQTYTQRVMLTEETQTVAVTPAVDIAWIHPNADERGYYHWTVSPDMMNKLSKDARASLSDRERMGVVYNLGNLLQAGLLHGDDYLAALSSFGGDATPEVVEATLDALRGVKFAFVTRENRNGYAAYVRRSFQPALDRIGLTPKPGDAPNVEELRPRLMTVLGIDGQDPALVKTGQDLTKSYLADPKSVDPSLVSAALRLAASQGDAALYDEYQKRFENAQTPVVRQRFLSALGGFRDSILVDRSLKYALEGPLKPQELLGIFRGADNMEMVDRLWPWYRDNYDAIMAKIPAAYRFYSIYLTTGCTQQRIDAVKEFFTKPEHAPTGMQQELGSLVSQMSTCVSLKDREGARVAKYLAQGASTPTATR